MRQHTLPDRDVLLQLMKLADGYREAFVAVQDQLQNTEMGRVPSWVFAVARLSLEDIEKIEPALADAERHRRACRVALHAMSELIALDDTNDMPPPAVEVESLINSLSPDEGGNELDVPAQRRLDGFISMMNYARTANVMYIDGTFDPITRPIGSE